MPIRDFPFTCIQPGGVTRPWLPIRITNPATGLSQNAYGLIDTGADECALPASYAPLLGHNLQAGVERTIQTGSGVTTAYSHTTSITIMNLQGEPGVTIDKTLIDFMPNLYVVLLGVKSFLSKFILTINYPSQKFSIQWP
jgi:predicted aspartyl protease